MSKLIIALIAVAIVAFAIACGEGATKKQPATVGSYAALACDILENNFSAQDGANITNGTFRRISRESRDDFADIEPPRVLQDYHNANRAALDWLADDVELGDDDEAFRSRHSGNA